MFGHVFFSTRIRAVRRHFSPISMNAMIIYAGRCTKWFFSKIGISIEYTQILSKRITGCLWCPVESSQGSICPVHAVDGRIWSHQLYHVQPLTLARRKRASAAFGVATCVKRWNSFPPIPCLQHDIAGLQVLVEVTRRHQQLSPMIDLCRSQLPDLVPPDKQRCQAGMPGNRAVRPGDLDLRRLHIPAQRHPLQPYALS
jgi:hypothetical protein